MSGFQTKPCTPHLPRIAAFSSQLLAIAALPALLVACSDAETNDSLGPNQSASTDGTAQVAVGSSVMTETSARPAPNGSLSSGSTSNLGGGPGDGRGGATGQSGAPGANGGASGLGESGGAPSMESSAAGTSSEGPAGSGGTAGSGDSGGAGGTLTPGGGAAGVGGSRDEEGGAIETGGAGVGGDPTGPTGGAPGEPNPVEFAEGFVELFIHDACTAPNPSQPDTCQHAQQHEEAFDFGGDTGTVYDVTLRVRGLFEPTTISGGQAPDSEHPYFQVGGVVTAADYSQWHIEISEPAQTYWLNHYPQTSHTIYQEDFEATIPIAGGAQVAVRVIDGNDRQIDNAAEGLADRQQRIEGVTDEVLDGQVLRLDVVDVVPRE